MAMALHSTDTSWGLIARLFHWIMAIMILLMLAGGLRMANTTDLIAQFEMVQQHKSIGFTVFVLAVLRLIWRWRSPATPRLPGDMPRWQVAASHISHVMLYILIVAIPISGWLMVTSSPLNDPGAYPTQIRNMVFGLFEMPDPFATGNAALSKTLRDIHEILGKLLMLTLLAHIGASLKHHFIDKDTILRRMIRG